MTTQVPVEREIMDIREAATYLGISGDTLYRYATDGFLPCFKLGNRWRFRKALLDEWIGKQCAANGKKGKVRNG